MQRKVIQQGPSTLMISLPSKWVKENNIKKGNEMNIELINNQLIASVSKKEIEKKVTLFIKNKEEDLQRILFSKYREGYNELIIKYEDPEVIINIRENLKYLLGFEILDQTAKSCTIKNVSEGSQENYTVMFRRMFNVLVGMTETVEEYGMENKESSLKAILDLRETIIKLGEFNLRILNKEDSFSIQKKSLEFFYVWNIAAFGRIWSSLAKECLSKKPNLSKEEVRFFKEVVMYNKNIYEIFYKRETEDLVENRKLLYKLRSEGAELLEKGKNKLMIFYLLRIVNRLYEMILTF